MRARGSVLGVVKRPDPSERSGMRVEIFLMVTRNRLISELALRQKLESRTEP